MSKILIRNSRFHFIAVLTWKESEMPYDFNQVLTGMRAAEEGAYFSCDEDSLRLKIREFQETLLEKQTRENLIDAETFLAEIAKQKDVVGIVPDKLYFKKIRNGTGKVVQASHTPLLIYILWTRNRFEESEVVSIDIPHATSLEDTIPGFDQGISGMQEGEIRQLFIHPDLAYGVYRTFFEPNILVIVRAEVVKVD